MKDPQTFCDTIKEVYNLKGVGLLSYHLGCGYTVVNNASMPTSTLSKKMTLASLS